MSTLELWEMNDMGQWAVSNEPIEASSTAVPKRTPTVLSPDGRAAHSAEAVNGRTWWPAADPPAHVSAPHDVYVGGVLAFRKGDLMPNMPYENVEVRAQYEANRRMPPTVAGAPFRVRRHPDDQAWRDMRQMGPSVADAEAEYRRRIDEAHRREAVQRQAELHHDLCQFLGEKWDVRPECRDWTPAQVVWLTSQYTLGDAELAWLRDRPVHHPPIVAAVLAVWARLHAAGRWVNTLAWPFQFVIALFGLFAVMFLFGLT
jgi:hypothetical protein